jgi:type I restriction enzyme R subunit
MEKNIERAVELYSGNKPISLFVNRLGDNLNAMNDVYDNIKEVFTDAGIPDFSTNPEDNAACGKFALLFRKFNEYLEAAKIQGFKWEQQDYEFQGESGEKSTIVKTTFCENDYLILALRYKELFSKGDRDSHDEVPYDIDVHLTEINTGKIDADYMNSRFDKYLKLMNLEPKPSKEIIDLALDDLHKTFATLTQEEQKYAGLFLRDIERGDVFVEKGKTFREYITEYQMRAKADQIHGISIVLGLDEEILRSMMGLKLTERNINEYGRFDALKATVDKSKARAFFEKQQNTTISPFMVSTLSDGILRKFLLEGGFDIIASLEDQDVHYETCESELHMVAENPEGTCKP